jgi:hypothetical protein
VAVPSNRVPVRVARGLKSALTANVADLLEGEVVYAKDEDRLYVIEGGVLVAMGADLGASSLGDLSDVDTTTAAPADKQALIWNNANSEWEPGDIVESDPSPKLSADLDVSTFDITTTATDGNVEIAANGTGTVVVRGNTNSAKLVLNCEANTHGVTIQSPPHSDAATYSLILPSSAGTAGQVLTSQAGAQLTWETPSIVGSIDDLNDVDTTTAAPTTGQVLEWDGANWVPATPAAGVGSIDDLSDVDTTTSAPTSGQVLEWDGTNWVPATLAAGGVTSIIAGSGISVDQATGDVTITATGGGLSGIGVATRVSDSGTAASSALTLTGLGSSGQLHTLSTDLDAWVVFYGSSADRTADAGRAYNTDPAAGSGVLAEAYVTTAGAILFTPGTGYMNNDTTETAALYLAVRDQAGAAVNATLTVTAYVQGGYDGVSGGTFGSG